MASRNADRQRRYRQRLQERGLVHVQGWVTPAQAEAIRRLLTERGGAAPHEPLVQQREPKPASVRSRPEPAGRPRAKAWPT